MKQLLVLVGASLVLGYLVLYNRRPVTSNDFTTRDGYDECQFDAAVSMPFNGLSIETRRVMFDQIDLDPSQVRYSGGMVSSNRSYAVGIVTNLGAEFFFSVVIDTIEPMETLPPGGFVQLLDVSNAGKLSAAIEGLRKCFQMRSPSPP